MRALDPEFAGLNGCINVLPNILFQSSKPAIESLICFSISNSAIYLFLLVTIFE
jgi:hypothetical protein